MRQRKKSEKIYEVLSTKRIYVLTSKAKKYSFYLYFIVQKKRKSRTLRVLKNFFNC